MICRVSHQLHSSAGPSGTVRSFNSARDVQFSVACVTANFGNLIIKDVSSTSTAEAIAGSQRQLFRTFQSATRNSCLGPFVKSRRQRRYVHSPEVAADAVPDDSTVSMGADTRSQGFRFAPSGEPGEGFNAELFQKQTEELRHAIISGELEVKPTPYTPVEGIEALQFYVTCALLFFAFWVGNYLAPNLIFRDTVFSKGSGEDDGQNDESPGQREQTAENQLQQGPGPVQSVDSATNSMKVVDGHTEKVGVGFGKATGQTPRKPNRFDGLEPYAASVRNY